MARNEESHASTSDFRLKNAGNTPPKFFAPVTFVAEAILLLFVPLTLVYRVMADRVANDEGNTKGRTTKLLMQTAETVRTELSLAKIIPSACGGQKIFKDHHDSLHFTSVIA